MLAFGTQENKDAHLFIASSFLMQSGLFQLLSSFCLSGKTVDIYHSSKQKKEEAFKHLNVSVYIFKYLVVISQ